MSGSLYKALPRGTIAKEELNNMVQRADDKGLEELEKMRDKAEIRKSMEATSSSLKESGYNPPPIAANRGANSSAGTGATGGQGAGNISAGNVTINAGSINLQGGANLNGNTSSGNTGGNQSGSSEGTSTSGSGNISARNVASDDYYEIGGRKLNRKDKNEMQEDAGVDTARARRKNSLYAAAHTLQDAMYITPPPGDWKGTYDAREAKIATKEKERKAEHEREKSAWANDKANISYRADLHMDKMREIYAGKPEAYIRDKAEEKAKTELAKMSEFVPYGITDVSLASNLYDYQKQYGFTPDQAIRSMARYNKFNSGKGNIAYAKKTAKEMGVKIEGNVKTVSQALPNAEYYFNSGYTKIEEISMMEDLAKRLETSPEFTMKIHEALKRKGGNINYGGVDKKVQKEIEDINKNYRKWLKNSGIK